MGYFYLALAHAAIGDLTAVTKLARGGRAEMERSSRRIHRPSIERETHTWAVELGLSPAAREAIGI